VARNAVPKYYQISRDIITLIQNGELVEGQQTPSENEIIKNYRVSNTTARKALYEIERAGWVKRIKGKGTYVCRNSVDRSINRILSFTSNMLEQGRRPSTRVNSIKVHESGHSVTIAGRQYTLDGPVCEIQRLRFADDVPMMREKRYISTSFCPGIENMDLDGSLYEIYSGKYGINLDRVRQTLSAIMLDDGSAGIFGAEKSIPAFYVEGVTFCWKELIVEMEESVYRGDIYKFSVEAT